MSISQPVSRPGVDRTGWPPGPWDDEPDRLDFSHAGLPCLLLRNRRGSWCGYPAVAPGHPMYGHSYDEIEIDQLRVNLDYSDVCAGEICHVPEPGQPRNVWWFGFALDHVTDICPAYAGEMYDLVPASYKTLAYARWLTGKLAEHLAALDA